MMHSLVQSLTFALQYHGASMIIQLWVYCQGELLKVTMHVSIATEIQCEGVLGERYVTLDTIATFQKLTSGEEAWPLMDNVKTEMSQES
jgi:hypothetical protein